MDLKNYTAARRHIAPQTYACYAGAITAAGEMVRSLGRFPLVIGGDKGFPRVADSLQQSLDRAGLPWNYALHRGFCSQQSIRAMLGKVRRAQADVVVAVGGGKVMDVSKAVAFELGLPCVTVPTSPATCAAVTALSVLYDQRGRWLGGMPLPSCPDGVLIDTEVVTNVPVRLLAAGVADGLAKYWEVRFAHQRRKWDNATSFAALALCERLKDILEAQAVRAIDDLARGARTEGVGLVAEAVILFPGIIGGLAGEANKLAAAHAVHNALTAIPASKQHLHGELVAFGILVQLLLADEAETTVMETVRYLAKLGVSTDLRALGCAAYFDTFKDSVLDDILSAPSVKGAFPTLSRDSLAAAIARADQLSCTHSGGGTGDRIGGSASERRIS